MVAAISVYRRQTMKRIKLNTDIGYWGRKDEIYDVSDQRAKELLKNRMFKDRHERYYLTSQAELVEDLGRHIGQSKHTYDMNGSSKAFGPGQPPKEVIDRKEILQRMIDRLNQGVKVFECKLCRYRNNPDIYAMEKIQGRWWHRFCLGKITWHTKKLIESGEHDKVKMLKKFRGKEHDRRRQEINDQDRVYAG